MSEIPVEIPRAAWLREWVDCLRRRAPLGDAAFDEVFPPREQALSSLHWTPVEVARATADFLVGDRIGTRVLDVGAGAGKFCLVGALVTKGRFFGIERHGRLCGVARALSKEYGVSRAAFFHGSHRDLDWAAFEAFYLFNPFQGANFREDVAITANKLADLSPGTRVATYHGFGGAFPSSYVRERCEWIGRGPLELWTKIR